MNESPSPSPPLWFWGVSAVALIWNLMGLAAFILQMMLVASPESLAQLPEAEQQLYQQTPAWVNVAFGVAVVGGVIASALLLLRKKWALHVFTLSIAGVLTQNGYVFGFTKLLETMGTAVLVMPILIILIQIYLFWFAWSSTQKGWLH